MTEYLGPKETDPDQIVTQSDIDSLTVSTVQIEADAVTNAKIGPLAVGTAEIAASAVTEAKLGTGAVTNLKIGSSAVGEGQLQNNAVTVNKIGPLAVTTAKINTDAVTNAKIGPLAVGTTELAASSVVTSKIKALNVTDAELATDAVTETKIAAAAVTLVKMGSINQDTFLGRITAGKSAPETLTASQARTVLNVEDGASAYKIAHQATAPATTQLWYHTTDKIVYYYDSTRTKWLSVNEYTVDAASPSASSTSNSILQQHGVSLIVSSSKRGHPLPYDCTVTGWYWHHGGSAVASRELALGRFDTSVATYNTRYYSVTPSAWQEFQEEDLNVDFDTQDLLGLIAYGTTVLVYPRCTVTYRRRTS